MLFVANRKKKSRGGKSDRLLVQICAFDVARDPGVLNQTRQDPKTGQHIPLDGHISSDRVAGASNPFQSGSPVLRYSHCRL